jgi:hypothetical protein
MFIVFNFTVQSNLWFFFHINNMFFKFINKFINNIKNNKNNNNNN